MHSKSITKKLRLNITRTCKAKLTAEKVEAKHHSRMKSKSITEKAKAKHHSKMHSKTITKKT